MEVLVKHFILFFTLLVSASQVFAQSKVDYSGGINILRTIIKAQNLKLQGAGGDDVSYLDPFYVKAEISKLFDTKYYDEVRLKKFDCFYDNKEKTTNCDVIINSTLDDEGESGIKFTFKVFQGQLKDETLTVVTAG